MTTVITPPKAITIALAGNPNTGKTTIFNNLTGARQHVGNYPGVTVEKKEGRCRHGHVAIHVVDLPGTYSLTAYAVDELVARNFLIEEQPDVVVNILDASNLERNLYLTAQLIELGVPLVLALNMHDVAQSRGMRIDVERLSQRLGVPVVPLVSTRNEGTSALLDAVVAVAGGQISSLPPAIPYGEDVEAEITTLLTLLKEANGLPHQHGDQRWRAVKLLEQDQDVRANVSSPAVLAQADRGCAQIEQRLGNPPEVVFADRRYGVIADICREAVRSTPEPQRQLSDRIDAIVTHRWLGIPLFLGLMYLVFQLTFTLGTPPMDWIDGFFGWLGETLTGFWPAGSESLLKSLLVDGVIAGVGGVLVFLPNIMLLFLAIALLEDTGYMARAAFIMDRLMHKIGLHGKSFIPFIIGFGCSVPAIMATRTLENKRDRLLTMLVVPLVSCGARLPIYLLIIPAFFPQAFQTPVLWVMYLIGILMAIVSAKVLSLTTLRGESAPFVMELPPYRLPTAKGLLLHMWERGRLYLAKAGTIILGISILLWVLTSFPKKTVFDQDYPMLTQQAEQQYAHDQEALDQRLQEIEETQQAEALAFTAAGRVGHAMEPALRPLGFDWRIGTAMIGALAAKEVFVAQMGIIFAVGEADETSDSLRAQLQKHYTPLVGFCIMLFCLLSAPCIATVAITKRESNSWKWALFQFIGLTILAYLVTLLVYQVGSHLHFGGS
ncbi:MAG: ferrous iron transport protein B [Armatimonadota bacterium]